MNIVDSRTSGDERGFVIGKGKVKEPLVESSFPNHPRVWFPCMVQDSYLERTVQFRDLVKLGIKIRLVNKFVMYKTSMR